MTYTCLVSRSKRIHKESWLRPTYLSKDAPKPMECGKHPFDFWEKVPIDKELRVVEKAKSDHWADYDKTEYVHGTPKEQLVAYAEEHGLKFCAGCFPHRPENARVHLQLNEETALEIRRTLAAKRKRCGDDHLVVEALNKVNRAINRRSWKVKEYGRWPDHEDGEAA